MKNDHTDLIRPQNLLLLSGGMNSVYLAHKMKEEGLEFECLHVLAGASSRNEERRYAEQTALQLGVQLHFRDLTRLYRGLGLKGRASLFAFPEFGFAAESPAWLALLSGVAGEFVKSHNFQSVYIGLLYSQIKHMPYCFLTDLQELFISSERSVSLKAPFVTGGAHFEPGLEVGIDFPKNSWSCVTNGSGLPCGRCTKCHARHHFFAELQESRRRRSRGNVPRRSSFSRRMRRENSAWLSEGIASASNSYSTEDVLERHRRFATVAHTRRTRRDVQLNTWRNPRLSQSTEAYFTTSEPLSGDARGVPFRWQQ